MPDIQRDRGPKGRWGQFSRTASFWVLMFLIPLLIYQVATPRNKTRAEEITYSTFRAQLRDKNIIDVTIVDGKKLEGKLRNPIAANAQNNRAVKDFWTHLPVKDDESLVDELEAANVNIKGALPRQNWWALLLGALPWILIIGFWIFMLRQMQVGGSKAFQFGKSKAKLLTGDTPKVTFADVAGADEAKDELQEIIEFLKDPQKFSRLGGRLPKGVLLIGPPGTGKTLLARAVAGEAARPFFSMSGSDFVEMFVGVGASRVRDLFEQGKAHAPCIIFIDEIDAVGRHRGAGLGGGHDEREQTLNQLLVEMDGFESNDGVILLAATNRPDVLDPALLRPGRFDRQVVVDAPDVRGREGILRVHLKKVPLADDVEVSDRAGHAGHERRRPGQPGERSCAARGAPRTRQGLHGRPGGCEGQGHAGRRAEEPGAVRSGAQADRVSRGGSRRGRAAHPRARPRAQDHDRAARPGAGHHRFAAGRRPPLVLARLSCLRTWRCCSAGVRRRS